MARGTIFGLSADAANVISGITVLVIVSRLLGPENRGLYFVVVLTATLTMMVAELGLGTAAMTFAAGRATSARRLNGLAIVNALGGGVAAAVIFLVLGPLWTEDVLTGVTRNLLVLLVLGVPPLIYAQVAGAVLTGLGQVPLLSKLRLGFALMVPAVMLPAAWISDGSAAWTLGAWLATTVAIATSTALALAHVGARPLVPRWSDARSAMSFGVRAQLGTLSHFGFLRIDALFISAIRGPVAVGIYSVSSVVAERLSVVGTALYGASVGRIGGSSHDDAARLTERLVRALITVIVPVGIVAVVAADPLLPWIFGSDFEAAVTPFRILVPGAILLTVWYLVSLYIVTTLRRPGSTTLIQAVALAVGVPLYLALIDGSGIRGAAIASTIIYSIVFLGGLLVATRLGRIELRLLVPRGEDVRDVAGRLARLLRAPAARVRRA